MKVLVKKANGDPKVLEIEDKLEIYQQIVGGHIEVFNLWDGIICICNDEGKLKGLLPNFMYYNDIICGDVIFASEKGEDIIGLTDEQISMLNIIFQK